MGHKQRGVNKPTLDNNDSAYRAALASLSKAELHTASFWLNSLGEDWRGDVPMKLHSRGNTHEGTLPFSPEFDRYIGWLECKQPDCEPCRIHRAKQKNAEGWRNPEPRLRATRAFRKLRKVAPREYDVANMYCILNYDVPQISRLLTERAIRLGKDERYSPAGVFLLLYSAINKVSAWW